MYRSYQVTDQLSGVGAFGLLRESDVQVEAAPEPWLSSKTAPYGDLTKANSVVLLYEMISW